VGQSPLAQHPLVTAQTPLHRDWPVAHSHLRMRPVPVGVAAPHTCPPLHSEFWQHPWLLTHCPPQSTSPVWQSQVRGPPAVAEPHTFPSVQSVLSQHCVVERHAPAHTRLPVAHAHMPLVHTAPSGQCTPSLAPVQSPVAPQNSVDVCGLMHTSPSPGSVQRSSVDGHDVTQIPLRQLLPMHCVPLLGGMQSALAPQ